MAAKTFPLATQDLADLMMVETVTWSLGENQELSGTGEGEWIAADMGPRLWQAECSTIAADIDSIEALRARFNLLDGAIQEFYLYDPARPNPSSDPAGAALAAATPGIYAIAGNRKELRLYGLPAGFVVPEGTRFSISAGSPSRTMLVQTAEEGVANGAGRTGWIELRPHLRPWVTTLLPVRLLKPVAKVKLMLGSLSVVQVTSVTYRLRFSARQTLAASGVAPELPPAPPLSLNFSLARNSQYLL